MTAALLILAAIASSVVLYATRDIPTRPSDPPPWVWVVLGFSFGLATAGLLAGFLP